MNKTKEYTPKELIDYCIRRIDENDPSITDATLYVVKCALKELKGKIK